MCEEILIETCFRKTITREVCRCTAKLLKKLRIDIFLSYKAKNVPFSIAVLYF